MCLCVQLEMERALLEGEQQIQLEQLDAAREKVTALEDKESRLLSEAASERSKVGFRLHSIQLVQLLSDTVGGGVQLQQPTTTSATII